jgi:predicted Zn-dependent protease
VTQANSLPRRFARSSVCLALAGAVAAASMPAAAQSRSVSVIRDAEIETLLRDYAEPILRAAGIGTTGAEIIILEDRTFNAFVASGNKMFINSGALLAADTPNEVIGVIAHETGHLAGGHLQGLRNEMARAQTLALIAGLLGAGAMITGAATGSQAGAQLGAAATSMGPGVAMRSLLSYKRAQESAADRAALTYLNATGQSAKGMIKTFRRFADQALFAKQYIDPYIQSHPMPSERIAQLETIASQSRYWDAKDPPSLMLRHRMMLAKMSAYLEGAARVERRFPRSDNSLPAAYARAIVAYRTSSLRSAIDQIDALIRAAPDYPYFHELKGQALLESGRAREAVPPLRRAVSLAPNQGLIRILLGHALLETGDSSLLEEAIANLTAGLRNETMASNGHRLLARAYAQQGRIAEAELATARGLMIDGQVKPAQDYARRAQAKLKRGTPGWLQAEDIITYKPPNT